VEHSGYLYLFRIGTNNGTYFTRYDGAEWMDWVGMTNAPATDVALAACSFQKQLHLFSKEAASGRVFLNRLEGAEWLGWRQAPPSGITDVSPAPSNYKGTLFLLRRQPSDGSTLIAEFDGLNWSDGSLLPSDSRTDVPVAACEYRSKLFIFRKDASSQRIMVISSQPSSPPVTCLGLFISMLGSNAVLSWEGVGMVQSAPELAGAWTDIPALHSPATLSFNANRRFFRLTRSTTSLHDVRESVCLEDLPARFNIRDDPEVRGDWMAGSFPENLPLGESDPDEAWIDDFSWFESSGRYDLNPGEQREVQVTLPEPAILHFGASWFGSSQPVAHILIINGSSSTVGTPLAIDDQRGAMITFLDLPQAGFITIRRVNQGTKRVTVFPVTGFIPRRLVSP
jgi:hypothetical protein